MTKLEIKTPTGNPCGLKMREFLVACATSSGDVWARFDDEEAGFLMFLATENGSFILMNDRGAARVFKTANALEKETRRMGIQQITLRTARP